MNRKDHHLSPPSASQVDTSQLAAANHGKVMVLAAGRILGALAASTCCILPLLLISLGISGAWIGQLTALSPYQPFFIAFTLVCLGYGFWMVYRKSRMTCDDGAACARPLPTRLVKSMHWLATALVALALAWPVSVPFILDR